MLRPRLTDFHGIHIPQAELDFAIPVFDEDIPLYVDPFLMWKSPGMGDAGLHQIIVNGFNELGKLWLGGQKSKAVSILVGASECEEVGLGVSANRKGKRIGQGKAWEILSLFETIEFYKNYGFRHVEEVQLFVEGIGPDRISDIACNFIKSFLIDFTQDQCARLGIPASPHSVENIFDHTSIEMVKEVVDLPTNAHDETGLLFVPKRWLRHTPFLSFDSYFKDGCPQDDIAHEGEKLERVKVLNYNRQNFGVVDSYVKQRELQAQDCVNDPLFTQIPVISAKRKLAIIKKLPTGKVDGADKKYEDAVVSLLSTLLYPKLDFADDQVRNDSGSSIRDLMFYNSQTDSFLKDLMDEYGSRQIIFELKNVANIGAGHFDQLNRYLKDDLGKFGVFVTRNPLKRAERRRAVDLWSGQRKAIITLSDADLEQMVELYESKQRLPMEVLKMKYVQFKRECP